MILEEEIKTLRHVRQHIFEEFKKNLRRTREMPKRVKLGKIIAASWGQWWKYHIQHICRDVYNKLKL